MASSRTAIQRLRIRGGSDFYFLETAFTRLLILVLLCLLLAIPTRGAAPRVLAVDTGSVIHPVTVDILDRACARARDEGFDAILIRINTPGGFLDASREAVEKIVSSPVPVIAFVTPSGGRAASAGFFLLEAADIAAMAPGTHAGAAHPVMFAAQQDPAVLAKATNDAAASLRALTARRARNPEAAEQAVTDSKSYTETEAVSLKLIDLIAADVAGLLKTIDGRQVTRFDGSKTMLRTAGAEVVEYVPSLREKIQIAVSDPNIALALLLLGALGLYVEFTSPGLILPGTMGAILVLLGLSAFTVLPVTWTGGALLILALALFVLEAKFASHGILGAGGVCAMVLGSLLLVDSPLPEARIRLSTALSLALPFAAIVLFLAGLVIRARTRRVETGAEGLLGASARALGGLAPDGRVLIHGEIWNAHCTRPVADGEEVRVTSIHGLDLNVEPVTIATGGSHA